MSNDTKSKPFFSHKETWVLGLLVGFTSRHAREFEDATGMEYHEAMTTMNKLVIRGNNP